jgi:hypothetical protein
MKKQKLLSEIIPLAQVREWDKNPRTVQAKDFERLKKQIQKFGVYKPLICCRENGHYIVLGGNMRLRALQELGHREVWISQVVPKSEAEKIEISLSDNDRIGTYDEKGLADLLRPLQEQLDLDAFKVDLKFPEDLADILTRRNDSDMPNDVTWQGYFEGGLPSNEKATHQVTFIVDAEHLMRLHKLLRQYDPNKNVAFAKMVDGLWATS